MKGLSLWESKQAVWQGKIKKLQNREKEIQAMVEAVDVLALDWKSLVTEILASGLTQEEIAAIIGMTQSNVSYLARGRHADVLWTTGQKLIALHKRRVKARRTEQVA